MAFPQEACTLNEKIKDNGNTLEEVLIQPGQGRVVVVKEGFQEDMKPKVTRGEDRETSRKTEQSAAEIQSWKKGRIQVQHSWDQEV